MERVQLNLERLLPELRDLEKKKLFTKVGGSSVGIDSMADSLV